MLYQIPGCYKATTYPTRSPFKILKNKIRTLILNSDTDRGQARWVNVEVWMCACFQCTCGLIFVSIFLEAYIPLPCMKLLLLCHQFCEVIVVDDMPELPSIKITRRLHIKEWRLHVGRGEKAVLHLVSLSVFCRTCKLEVEGCSKGLRGQNKQRAWSFMLLQKILLSLKLPASRAKERGRGKRV